MKTLSPETYRDLSKLRSDGAMVWCVAVEAAPGRAFYLTENPRDVRFRGRVWQSFPFKLGSIEDEGEGNLPGSDLSVSNVGRLPMQFLEAGDWDQGEVVRHLVYVPDPDRETRIGFRERIQSASATDEVVTLKLGQPNYLSRQFPGRRYIRDGGYPGIPRNPA